MRVAGLSVADWALRGRTDVDRRAVDATLPHRFRGRRGYQRLLDAVPLRVSVSGTRGKSGLTRAAESALLQRGYRTYAKQTGTDPISIRDGEHHPIDRPTRGGALFDENIWEVKRWYGDGVDALVLENQAISAYTMRVFNELFCKPHYLLLTNVRRDHVEDLGDDITRHPAAFARSAPRGCTLISGDADEDVAYLLRRECESVGARFVDAAPERDRVFPPGYESVTVLDTLLRLATGQAMSDEELQAEHDRIATDFVWQDAALPGVAWFPGAEINDVDSTRAILRWLNRQDPKPTSFIAYLRADRRGRTATHAALFAEGLAEGWCERVYLAGHGSSYVARRLRQWGDRVRVYDDDLSEVDRMVDDVGSECTGEAVMTVVNAVPPFPREVAARLRGDRE